MYKTRTQWKNELHIGSKFSRITKHTLLKFHTFKWSDALEFIPPNDWIGVSVVDAFDFVCFETDDR